MHLILCHEPIVMTQEVNHKPNITQTNERDLTKIADVSKC